MALITLPSHLRWPGTASRIIGGGNIGGSTTLDAAGEYYAYVIQARENMTITHVGVKLGAVTGAPVGEIRIETVDATGIPTGTLWATDTNLSGISFGLSWASHALTASASILKGEFFAVKFLYASGTSFRAGELNNWAGSSVLPYLVTNISGSAAKSSLFTNTCHLIGLANSGTWYNISPALLPVTTITHNTFNNTNSAARGLRFKVPFKCRVVGIGYCPQLGSGDFNAGILDDAGAELSSSMTAFDPDFAVYTTSNSNINILLDNSVTLEKDTWYRAVIEPTSATTCTITTLTVGTAAARMAMLGGENQHYATRVSGTWTDTATDQIPLIDVLLDQIDDGTGTGGTGGSVIGS